MAKSIILSQQISLRFRLYYHFVIAHLDISRSHFASIIILSHHTGTFLDYISLISRLYFAYIIILSQQTWTYISLIFCIISLIFSIVSLILSFIMLAKKQKHAYISFIFRLYYYVDKKNSLIFRLYYHLVTALMDKFGHFLAYIIVTS